LVDGGRPLEVLDSILEQYRVVQHGVAIYFGSAEFHEAKPASRLVQLLPGVGSCSPIWMNGLADGRNLCALLSGFRDCLWLVNAKPQWVVTGVLSTEAAATAHKKADTTDCALAIPERRTLSSALSSSARRARNVRCTTLRATLAAIHALEWLMPLFELIPTAFAPLNNYAWALLACFKLRFVSFPLQCRVFPLKSAETYEFTRY
jgi:hypothetical protein